MKTKKQSDEKIDMLIEYEDEILLNLAYNTIGQRLCDISDYKLKKLFKEENKLIKELILVHKKLNKLYEENKE